MEEGNKTTALRNIDCTTKVIVTVSGQRRLPRFKFDIVHKVGKRGERKSIKNISASTEGY